MSTPPAAPAGQDVQPLKVNTARLVLIGTSLWAVALVLTLALPSLHQGTRHWWPWAAAAGIGLGLVALVYVRRGRGNAVIA